VVLPPEDWIHDNGRADVRDDQEQLQERSEVDAIVGAGTGDVASGVVENRLEENQRGDRRDDGDEEQHPKGERNPSTWAHLDSFLSRR
jgi:hypothetical protein